MPKIRTLELAAWDIDEYQFRPQASCEEFATARRVVAARETHQNFGALCEDATMLHQEALEEQLSRCDLHSEMRGLDWSLGIVDLRHLLAFQRRLSFNFVAPEISVCLQEDWRCLMDLSFAKPNPIVCDMVHDAASQTVLLQSSNPNLHLRVTENPSKPLEAHAGSPFFEVAHYAGRWFLRDGYHRAYALLRAGVVQLPAVIVHARTLEELGAIGPRFFSEAILLSDRPPFVTDFLDEALTIQYDRPLTIKTLRVTIAESIAAAPITELSGEQP